MGISDLFSKMKIIMAMLLLLLSGLIACANLCALADQTPTWSQKPILTTLTINHVFSTDMEIIQWPDGQVSLPIKAVAVLLALSPQQSDTLKTLFYIDTTMHQQVTLNWQTQQITVNNTIQSDFEHPLIAIKGGMVIENDVYVDQTTLSTLLDITIKLDNENALVEIGTHRALKMLANNDTNSHFGGDSPIDPFLVDAPVELHSLVEKAFFAPSTTSLTQLTQQPLFLTPNAITRTQVSTVNTGVQGTLLKQPYYFKPAIQGYNGRVNCQTIDWAVYHDWNNHQLKLGNMDVGLGTLTSPSLQIWGLRFASRNALLPVIRSIPPTPKQPQFVEKSPSMNVKPPPIQSSDKPSDKAKISQAGFEPINFELTAMEDPPDNPAVVDTGPPTVLHPEISYFPDMLAKGEPAYSGFLGRVPLRFSPIIPGQTMTTLLPQSEKWLTGVRYNVGVTDRFTLGVATSADEIFGKPRTPYWVLNPLYADLTGYSGYRRDPNLMHGENVALSARYQLAPHWQLVGDWAGSVMNMSPMSHVPLPETSTGLAEKLALNYQRPAFHAEADLFRYDPTYYTPSSVYSNFLYDQQGVGLGANGTLNRIMNLNYSVNWDHYQTNLDNLIAGGLINANHWRGNLSKTLTPRTTLSLDFNWTDGTNNEREFLQQLSDVNLKSRLWRDWTGEIHLSQSFTNTLMFPTPGSNILTLLNTPYRNNGLGTSVDIPLHIFKKGIKNAHVKVSQLASTYVNDVAVQTEFWIKNFFFAPLIQQSYGNTIQTQNSAGLKVGFQLKSGAKLSVAYYNNTSVFRGFGGLPYETNIHNHTFYCDFSDVLELLGSRRRVQSLGPNGDATASLSGMVYADFNNNNVHNPTEIGVPHVALTLDQNQTVITDSQGHYVVNNLSKGYHTLAMTSENLPVTLNAENTLYKVNLKNANMYQLNIGLTPQGAMISGTLAVHDIADNAAEASGIVLVVLDVNGKIVNYASSDANGHYTLGNLLPGQYTIDLAPQVKDSGHYKILSAPAVVNIDQPTQYEMREKQTGLNFQLLKL